MDKMMKLGKALTIVLVIAGVFACSDDDNSAPFEVIGDVFVIKRNIDGEDQFANSYVAWGNQPMSHAEVTTPAGANMTLNPASDNLNTYAKEPTLANYSTSAPTEGNYQFLVINEDITHQAVDLLDFDNIDYTGIVSATVDMDLLSVEWESNNNAEAFLIRLMNEAGEIAFLSQTLPVQMSYIEIGSNTASGSWLETPQTGNIYTLELLTFRFEDDAVSSDAAYHIQEVAITEQQITWQ